MLRKPDFFVRKVKYSLPPNRKLRFEFNEKKYETKVSFYEKSNFQQFVQTFLTQNKPNLLAEDYEIIRNNKVISKASLVAESCLKNTFKVVPFELNREKFHIENNIPVQVLNFGFNPYGQYSNEKNVGSNFFVYLKHKIDPKRYEVQKDLLAEKTHQIKTSYNTATSRLLENKFYRRMKDLPNSGYEKMGKFIVGIFDKQFYQQFTSNMLTHILEINSENANSKLGFNRVNNDKFLVEIDFALRGIFTPETNLDLLIRKEDYSLMLPITFAKHTNDILNYKKFLEFFLMTGRDIAIEKVDKNDKEISPTIEKRLAKFKKDKVEQAIYLDMMGRSFEQFELHSFVNYNALKIKSHYRTQLGKRMHFGASFLNDKFRFQLLVNHPDQRVIDNFSLSKSKVFSFEIDPYTNTLMNVEAIKEFLDHFNIFNKIPDEELYHHFLNFEKLYKSKYFEEKQDKVTLGSIRQTLSNKFNPKEIKETTITRRANEIELDVLEQLKAKQNYNADV